MANGGWRMLNDGGLQGWHPIPVRRVFSRLIRRAGASGLPLLCECAASDYVRENRFYADLHTQLLRQLFLTAGLLLVYTLPAN